MVVFQPPSVWEPRRLQSHDVEASSVTNVTSPCPAPPWVSTRCYEHDCTSGLGRQPPALMGGRRARPAPGWGAAVALRGLTREATLDTENRARMTNIQSWRPGADGNATRTRD